MIDLILGLIGLAMIYATIHYIVLSFQTKYSERTSYQKAVSIVGIVSIGLVYLSLMFG